MAACSRSSPDAVEADDTHYRIAEGTSTIHIWDVETRQKVASLPDCKMPFWSPDGRHLVTIIRKGVGAESTVRVWEVADPTPAYRLDRPVRAISSSPDGRRLAVDDRLWDVVPGTVADRLQPRAIALPADLAAFTRSGALLCYPVAERRLWRPPRAAHSALATRTSSAASWSCPHSSGRTGSPTPATAASRPSVPTVDSCPFSGCTGKIRPGIARPLGSRSNFGSWRRRNNCACSGGNRVLRLLAPTAWLETKAYTYWVNDPIQFAWSNDSRMLAVAFSEGVVIYNIPDGKPIRWLGPMAQCVASGPRRPPCLLRSKGRAPQYRHGRARD